MAPEIEIDDYSKKTGRRSRERFVSDYTALINFMTSARLHEDTRREILYQAIRMYSGLNGYFDHTDYTYISDEARSLCDALGKPHARSTIIKEHVVPISVSIEWLWQGAGMTQDRVRQIFEIASTVCIVSKAEDARLRAAGLQRKLPTSDATPEAISLWERYDHEKVRISRRALKSSGDPSSELDPVL